MTHFILKSNKSDEIKMNPFWEQCYFNKWVAFLIIILVLLVTYFTIILLLLRVRGYMPTTIELLEELKGLPLEISTPDNSSAQNCRVPTKLCPSTRDKRKYEYFVLTNEMRVVVISDPEIKLSSVAMTIDTGSFNDPASNPGLAHLCEHMLFLGTAKYPDTDMYHKYIYSHGGKNNAFTLHEETTFYFTIQSPYLKQALDIFSQFFISPLVNEELLSREINAVHEEYHNFLHSDQRREDQLLKHVSNPQHPFHQFDTGNNDTLNKTDIREKILKVYAERYSSNTVSLVHRYGPYFF